METTSTVSGPRRRTQAGSDAALAFLAAALFASAPVHAADGQSANATLLARLHEGLARDVVVVGDVAWVGLDTGVAAYDVRTPAAPARLGHVYLPSEAFGLAVAGTHLLVANGESGLVVIDAADPSNPRVVQALPSPHARAVAVSSNLACVVQAGRSPDWQPGLVTLDVSNPAAPVPIGFAPLPNGGLAVWTDGARALAGVGSDVTMGNFGLALFDVSAPANPTPSGFHGTGQPVNGVDAVGGVAWLAVGLPLAGAVEAVDVTTPASPSRIGRIALGDSAEDVQLDGALALVAARALGLVRVDASNPTMPRVVDSVPTGRESVRVFGTGPTAYLAERASAGEGALTSVGTPAPPALPTVLGRAPHAEATDVALLPGLALFLNRDALHVHERGGAWGELSAFTVAGADFSVLAAGGTLAAVGEGDCVRLVDLGDPFAASEVGQACLTEGTALGLDLEGGILHVATGRSVDLYDVSVPSAPGLLGRWISTGWASDVAVDGRLAAVASGTAVAILAVDVPAMPSWLGDVDVGDTVSSVAIEANLAVATGLANRAHLVDVADPAAPSVVSVVPGGPGQGVQLQGGKAFVAADRAGLVVLDVSTPTLPVETGSYDASGAGWAVAADGSTVLLAATAAQHWVFSCASCVPACSVNARIDGATTACFGQELVLDASASTPANCAGDTLAYQWFEGGAPIPAATGPTYTVPGTQAVGFHDFSVEVSCAADPSCLGTAGVRVEVLMAGTWPEVHPLSLRVRRMDATDDLLTWTATGTGEFNVHRSTIPRLLAPWLIDGTSVVAVEPATSHVNVEAPPPLLCFRVHGRDSCTGESVIIPWTP